MKLLLTLAALTVSLCSVKASAEHLCGPWILMGNYTVYDASCASHNRQVNRYEHACTDDGVEQMDEAGACY